MKKIIYCKPTNRGKQTHFLKCGERSYMLFTCNYRKTNDAVFRSGRDINSALALKSHYSTSERMVADKLPLL